MTDLNFPAPGTAPSVPGAHPPHVDVPDVNTLARMLHAMVTLSGASAATPPNTSQPSAPAPAAPAPVVPVAVVSTPAVVAPPVAPPAHPGLRTSGPWLVGELYIVVPPQHLQAIPDPPLADDAEAPVWYAITKGRFVGVTLSNALALAAITGVSGGSMRKHKTQVLALGAFNTCVDFGTIAVVP
ncbi:hypothetical protein R3P38DRAFT_3208579 [Favolaschia claudopus]|uniref:Uncharacterized protein n=1 Tax=Favolaschia claudopus TaxID=2862362 RepID=A0AAW0AJM2_9AGAR